MSMNTTPFQVVAQAIGFLGMFSHLASFQCKKRQGILGLQIAGSTFYAIHFGLLGAVSGAAMNVIALLRCLVFYRRGERKWADSPVWIPVFLAIIAGATAVFWEGPKSLLTLAGMVCTTFAMHAPSARAVRLLNLPSDPLWLIYNAISGSISGVITEVGIICSILIGFLRHDRAGVTKS